LTFRNYIGILSEKGLTLNYCSSCGHKISFGKVPEDDIPRYHCEKCGAIHYQNPKMIVGTIPYWQDKILLCKRAIEPRKNLWTLPAGFLEDNEKIEEGAVRETEEEANANIEIVRLFAVYSLPKVSQVYFLFLANLLNLDFRPGAETLEVTLFKPEEIPWQEIAFSSIKFTLEKYCQNSEPSKEKVFFGSSERGRLL